MHTHHLLVPYGPPYYGMGSMLHRLLGGWAPRPGETGRVTIRPTPFAGCGPLRCFTDRSCAAAVVRSPVRGVATRPWCDPEEVILPLRGGVYGESTPSGDCPALCGGFRSGHLSEGNPGINMAKSTALWLAPVFTARKGDVCLEEAADCGSQSPARRRPRGLGCVIMGNA